MNKTPERIKIEDAVYVREDIAGMAESVEGLKYVIIRSRDSGCHAGYLSNRTGSEVELLNARRLWAWAGAATLSQLAIDGVSKPNECKFPQAVPCITVIGVCEVIPATEKCRDSIESVPQWKV